MKLWKRAAGAIKDRNSLWLASLSRQTELWNPDIEAVVIKATSHDDSHLDLRNIQHVFSWLRVSSAYIKPVMWAIAVRMQKTRDWVVVLKGLMLLHGVFSLKVPAIHRVGRLPFDLASFKDGHSSPGKTWGYNAFVRAYFAYLDHKSTFICRHAQQRRQKEVLYLDQDGGSVAGGEKFSALQQHLAWLQNLQGMLDMLLQIKPQQDGMVGVLVLEAMDCIVIEIFDVYSLICSGIAKVLMNIYSFGKVEAAMALGILQKAATQGEELTLYFEFCRDIGVINAAECPKVERIPETELEELEQIIHGVSEKSIDIEEETALIVKENNTIHHERKDFTSSLQTVVTDKWEVFEEEPKKAIVAVEENNWCSAMGKNNARVNPFVASLTTTRNELPDLISFI